jgi:hypothetical protein
LAWDPVFETAGSAPDAAMILGLFSQKNLKINIDRKYKKKLHTNGFCLFCFLGFARRIVLPCPVHPALLHNFGCCYIILMRHKKNQDKNEQFNITFDQC